MKVLQIGGAGMMAGKRAEAIAQINAMAGVARGHFITISPGQDMIYMRKEEEARRWLTEPTTPETLDGYPFIAAEIGITAPDATQLAQIWVNMAAMFEVVGAGLENGRLGAVATVENATSAFEIDAAVAGFAAALGMGP